MAESQSDITPRSGATSFTRSGVFRREIGLPAATLFAFCAIGLSLGGAAAVCNSHRIIPRRQHLSIHPGSCRGSPDFWRDLLFDWRPGAA